MSNPLEKLHLRICAAAAAVVTIACIVVGAELLWTSIWVSGTIAMFYVVGSFVRYFMTTNVFPVEEEVEVEEVEEEESLDELDDDEEDGELVGAVDAFMDSQ